MSTTGTERHCRLCLMVNKGGIKVCHHLLLKRVNELSPPDHKPYPWTVQQFLESKKQSIKKSKLTRDKCKVLFPSIGETSLSEWDLSLFCKVLTLYCGLEQLLRLDIEQFLDLRNKLCHMNDPDITPLEFDDNVGKIRVCIGRITNTIGDQNLKREVETIITDLQSGPLSLDEALKEMRIFYFMSLSIEEKFDRVLHEIEKLDGKYELICKKLDEKNGSKLDPASNVPGLNLFLDLKNVTLDEEAKMSAVLHQLFDEVINNKDDDFISSIPKDSHVRLRSAVLETFQKFIAKGWRITSAKHECIRLHIKCENFTSLAALLRDHIQGKIDKQLTDLNEALSECMSEKKMRIVATIFEDEFWNVVDQSFSSMEDFLADHGETGNDNSNDNGQTNEARRRHAVLLTAQKSNPESTDAFEGQSLTELMTCFQSLKRDIEFELTASEINFKAELLSNDSIENIGNQIMQTAEESSDLEMNQTETDEKCSSLDESKKEAFEIEDFGKTEGGKEKRRKDIETEILKLPLTPSDQIKQSKEGRKFIKRVKKDVRAVSPSASTSFQLKGETTASIGTKRDFHVNALQGITDSEIAASFYFELARLTLFDENLQEELNKMREPQFDIWHENRVVLYEMYHIASSMKKLGKRHGEEIRGQVEKRVNRIEHNMQSASTQVILGNAFEIFEKRLVSKVSTKTTSNKEKVDYGQLQHLQKVLKDEELSFQEWKRNLEESVTIFSKKRQESVLAETMENEEENTVFESKYKTPDSDDMGTETPFMYTQGRIEPSEIRLRHEKDVFRKDHVGRTLKALTEMLRPGPALVNVNRELDFKDYYKMESHYRIFSSDSYFGYDSDFLEDIKRFCQSFFETNEDEREYMYKGKREIIDPLKQQGKEKLEQDEERREGVELYNQRKKEKHKTITEKWSTSLKAKGEEIALCCIQRMKIHLESIDVQNKRIKNSISQVQTGLTYLSTTLDIKDIQDIRKEWYHVKKLAGKLKRMSFFRRPAELLYLVNIVTDDARERRLRLRLLLDELETKS